MSPPTVKIYVGNIPSSARNSELKELFEKFGKVVECDILKDYGFVHMSDTNDAKAAIAGLNDTLWKGGRIRVELSTTKTSKGKPAPRKQINNHGPNDRYNNAPHMNGRNNNGYPPMHRSRPAPYPRDFGHHHPYVNGNMDMGPGPMGRSARNGGGGGPMRGSDSRYSNGGGRYNMPPGQLPPPDRSRPLPYPDQQFDHRNGAGRIPPPPNGNMSNGSMNGGPRNNNDYSYKNGGSDSRDNRSSGGSFQNGNIDHPPYPGMRGQGGPPHMPPAHHLPPPGSIPPPHMGHHDDYYRGGPPPMGPPRYDNFDHYGPPGQSGGSRSGRYNNYK